jgi:transcriptional regulator with XRE-family HTH domain
MDDIANPDLALAVEIAGGKRALAAALGVSRQALYRWVEGSARAPSEALLLDAAAQALGLDLQQLADDERRLVDERASAPRVILPRALRAWRRRVAERRAVLERRAEALERRSDLLSDWELSVALREGRVP